MLFLIKTSCNFNKKLEFFFIFLLIFYLFIKKHKFMNNSSNSQDSFLNDNSSTYFLMILLIISVSSSILLICICLLRRIFHDIQRNTLRIPNKQIKTLEKTSFQSMSVNTCEENIAVSQTLAINESLDYKKSLNSSDFYEKQEKNQKEEIISAIDINVSEI